jgi:hypothetical protein
MQQTIWALANLTPEQERLLKEAEATLGSGVLLAFKGSEVTPSELTPSQLACLQGLEQRLGMVIVALHPG